MKEKILISKASSIDIYSRFIFPFCFFAFHLIYWHYYLTLFYNFDSDESWSNYKWEKGGKPG
jgi:hypothetical protein